MVERMFEVKVAQLLPGDIIAADVYSPNGKILVVKNTKVTDNIILGLKKNYIFSVYIFRSVSEEEEIISINIKNILVKETDEIINNYVLKFIKKDRNIKEIKKVIMDTLISDRVFNLLFSLRALGEDIYRHSVCVAFYSLAIAMEMSMLDTRLDTLCQAALLHDIGMIRIPKEVLKKTGTLSDEEKQVMQMHPKHSFDILQTFGFPAETCTIVIEHHERYDGTGYPNQLTNDKVHTMAKIIAVSDVYDALSSDRPYRPKYKRSETVEYLLGTGNFYFNYEIVRALINSIIIYPYGQWVELSTKEIGVVVDEEVQQSNFKPRLLVYFNEKGERLTEPKVVDLSLRENANISVERIV
jgi:putative nucleotidyltransferase with HDIG domain